MRALTIVPLELREANRLVIQWHRHHQPARGQKFSIGVESSDKVCGAAIVGRPVSRGCDSKKITEVTRCVTNGTKNACSKLYSAAARIAREMGYRRIQTYILASESGASLLAAGWRLDGTTRGGQWDHTSERQLLLEGGTRRSDQPIEPKQRWVKDLA